jgi:hypothetical protein
MAYDATHLRLLGGVPGQQIFLYSTADALSTVVASGYFDAAADHYNLSTGDVLLAVCSTGGTKTVDLLVATVAAGTATVINGS